MINTRSFSDRGTVAEYPLGDSLTFPGSAVSIVSRRPYQRIEHGASVVTCPVSEVPIVGKCLSGRQYETQESLFRCIQREVQKGIFSVLSHDSLMIAAPLLDDTLAVSNFNKKTIVGDSIYDIALSRGAQVSLSCLAMNLIHTLPYYPFQCVSLWDGVRRVIPLHSLVLTQSKEWGEVAGTTETTFAQETANDYGAIRTLIVESLIKSISPESKISADLSGGIDSAVVAYMLKALNVQGNFYHAEADMSANSDTVWAGSIARDAGISYTSLPALSETGRLFDFKSKYSHGVVLDAPMLWSDSEGYAEQIVRLEGGRGKGIHFTGLGGDELFAPMPAFAWSAARESRKSILFWAFRYSLATRASFRRGFIEISDDADYLTELTRKVETAFSPTNRLESDDSRASRLGWLGSVRLPRWMTDAGRQLALTEVQDVLAKGVNPLANERSKHQSVESIIFQRRVLNQLNRLYASLGGGVGVTVY